MSAVIYRRRNVIAKRVVWTIMIIIGLSLLAVLYNFKTMAQSARKDVRALKAKIATEEESINLLRAEIIFLERGDRISELANEMLALEPVQYEGTGSGLSAVAMIALRDDAAETKVLSITETEAPK